MAIEESLGWVPQACSLPTAQRPLRVAEFDRLFAESVLGLTRVNLTRLDVELKAAAADRARDLAVRESACCSFFTFSFVKGVPNVVMRIEVPAAQTAVIDSLAARVDAVTRGGLR
ncbi:hypothetical protein ACWGPP_19270 [Agromyces sp. NPDC055657]